MRAFRKKVTFSFPFITEAHNNVKVLSLSGLRQRNKRNLPQTQPTPRTSLQHLRQEIDKKLSQVCTSKDKVCQSLFGELGVGNWERRENCIKHLKLNVKFLC